MQPDGFSPRGYFVGVLVGISANVLAWCAVALLVRTDSAWSKFSDGFAIIQVCWLAPLGLLFVRRRKSVLGIVSAGIASTVLSMGFCCTGMFDLYEGPPSWVPWGLRDDGRFAGWREILVTATTSTDPEHPDWPVERWPVPRSTTDSFTWLKCRFEQFVLRDASGRDVFAVNMWSWERPRGLIVLDVPWFATWEWTWGGLRVAWWNADTLAPLASRDEALAQLEDTAWFASPETQRFESTISLKLDDGSHPVSFPEGIPRGRALAIWIEQRQHGRPSGVFFVDPEGSSVTVTTLGGRIRDVARLAWDPKTRRVLGEGRCVTPFVLTSELNDIAVWLR